MDPEEPFREGTVLVEKYRLERLLGTGGMGMVYAATHLDLAQRVAIKLLRREHCNNEAAVLRFLLEARATARLRGPHVARVLDVGRLATQTPFLVMEFLEGENLQDYLVKNGRCSMQEAIDSLLEACEAVAEAHRAGIVHRDLKPANLFLTRDAYGAPSIKVLDFGISKHLDPTGIPAVGLTDSRTFVGSPVYMSPEQMRSARDVDHRTDIWSLGAVLFELLTGRPVWAGQVLSEVCAQVIRDPCPNLFELRPQLAPELSEVVARCLQKDPGRRFQQVTDLALALQRFASPRGQSTVPHVLYLSGQTEPNPAETADAAKAESTGKPYFAGASSPFAPRSRSANRGTQPWAVGFVSLLLVSMAIVGLTWYGGSGGKAPVVPDAVASTVASAAPKPVTVATSLAAPMTQPLATPLGTSPPPRITVAPVKATESVPRTRTGAPARVAPASLPPPGNPTPITTVDPMSLRR